MRFSTILTEFVIISAAMPATFSAPTGGVVRAQQPADRMGRPVTAVRAITDATNRFAWELYGQFRAESDGNLFFSPQSISIALAMTQEGARGETAKQMGRVLHVSTPQADTVPGGYAELLARLNGRPAGGAEREPGKRGYELSVANRLWGHQGYQFVDRFLMTLRDKYQAELGQVDFIEQPDVSRRTINNWVARQTNDKIKDLIPSGAVDPMTRLVLTNAIYFKGAWAQPFDKTATRPMAFHLAADRQVDVPMMYQQKQFKFAKHADVLLIEMPYQGEINSISMLVILPTKVDGLPEIENQLSTAKLAEWTATMRQTEVDVWLPKFNATSEFELNLLLSKLGMTLAFQPGQADFSGMNGNRELFISAALHKAHVDVNEEGTEAAAATGVVVRVKSVPVDPPTFKADHPFVFVIRDDATGGALFIGRVMDPR
jgi:serpin B